MEKVLKTIKNSFGKIGTAYKKFSEKDERIDTIITISGVMLFAFLVMFTCQKIMGANAVSIATNKAEASFFEGDYDAAIAEYEKLQEDDEWPCENRYYNNYIRGNVVCLFSYVYLSKNNGC